MCHTPQARRIKSIGVNAAPTPSRPTRAQHAAAKPPTWRRPRRGHPSAYRRTRHRVVGCTAPRKRHPRAGGGPGHRPAKDRLPHSPVECTVDSYPLLLCALGARLRGHDASRTRAADAAITPAGAAPLLRRAEGRLRAATRTAPVGCVKRTRRRTGSPPLGPGHFAFFRKFRDDS